MLIFYSLFIIPTAGLNMCRNAKNT